MAPLIVAAPTRAELEAYFNENRHKYVVDEVVTFEHVFFAYGSDSEPSDAAGFLSSLRAGTADTDSGDNVLFGRVLRDRSRVQLSRTFGVEFADQAFSLPVGQWQGPIDSPSGIHYLRITQKQKPPPPTFEQLEDFLRQDWMFKKRRAVQDEKIAELSKRYRVVYSDEQ